MTPPTCSVWAVTVIDDRTEGAEWTRTFPGLDTDEMNALVRAAHEDGLYVEVLAQEGQ